MAGGENPERRANASLLSKGVPPVGEEVEHDAPKGENVDEAGQAPLAQENLRQKGGGVAGDKIRQYKRPEKPSRSHRRDLNC